MRNDLRLAISVPSVFAAIRLWLLHLQMQAIAYRQIGRYRNPWASITHCYRPDRWEIARRHSC